MVLLDDIPVRGCFLLLVAEEKMPTLVSRAMALLRPAMVSIYPSVGQSLSAWVDGRRGRDYADELTSDVSVR
jgi:hypothetical protein